MPGGCYNAERAGERFSVGCADRHPLLAEPVTSVEDNPLPRPEE